MKIITKIILEGYQLFLMKTTENILGPQKIAHHEIETQIRATSSSLLNA